MHLVSDLPMFTLAPLPLSNVKGCRYTGVTFARSCKTALFFIFEFFISFLIYHVFAVLV